MKKIVLLLSAFVTLNTFAVLPIMAQDQASEEAEGIRDKVKQKVELTRKNPKAYLGTITDKTEATLEIKTENGEIQQISIDEQTSYVKLEKAVIRVKFTDLAIGDYAIAMGFKDPDGVLSAKRILLTTAPQPINRQVLKGTVTSIKKSEMTFQDTLKNREYQVKPGKTIFVTLSDDGKISKLKYSDINQGDNAIIIGFIEEGALEARRIHITLREKSPEAPSPTPKEKSSQ